MDSVEADWHKATDPATPARLLLELLLDFPAEVLRNPAFRLAVAADPGLARSTTIARRAVMALDKEYRAIGLESAPDEVRGFVEFCDQRNRAPFRFQPRPSMGEFKCSPTGFREAAALRTALRCASALAPTILGGTTDGEIRAWYRHDASEFGTKHLGSSETVIRGKRGNEVVMPGTAGHVLRELFDFHGSFELVIKDGGFDVGATLWGAAWSASLEMVRSQGRGALPHDCFEIDGETKDRERIQPADPGAFDRSVRTLERMIPKRAANRIVLVIDDTHGDALDCGVNAFSRDAEELLESQGVRGLRETLRGFLVDACDELGIDAGDPAEDKGDLDDIRSSDVGSCRIALSEDDRSRLRKALDELHLLARPALFGARHIDEFEFRIAAFRAGKLIAYRADRMEIQPIDARGSLKFLE